MAVDAPAGSGAAPWKLLLVDDEPAVHEVSRLVLADLEFEGRAVEMLSALSAAQARETLARIGGIALVLLDVVMETDDAGLALVAHIREQLGDRDVQIVLRTGQPGMAPERDVVLRHEINGYYLKTDITAQRLHSIVVAALRSYRYARELRGAALGRPAAPPRAAPVDPAHAALADELARAAPADAVLLLAQPEVALASNAVVGVELVPQWRSSQGVLTAARVGELLAEPEARARVALWLLAQACGWARTWMARGGAVLPVSVPLVGDALGDCRLFEVVLQAVHEAELPVGTLDLQVGEATLNGDDVRQHEALAALREAGVSFTLLDFGAQTISLQRLSHLAPDRLKIHRPFVRGVAADPERMGLARAVIALAQTLHIVAIADGIASDADAQFFKWEGCDLGQGDALAPACAPADVAESIRRGRRSPH